MMVTHLDDQTLIQRKLEAFERMQPEFEESFQFVQEMHGQKRFSSLRISDIVRYLHSLWICERKSYLLSVYKTVKVYDGRLCLELLRQWQQEEDTAGVIAFLQRKLDMMPFADITRQVHEAQHMHADAGLMQRLIHGQLILLNRGFNQMWALDALFSLSDQDLLQEVRAACELFGHLPDQIAQQFEEIDSPLYAFVPRQALAQRNMAVMNKLGVNIVLKPSDLPGERSWRVTASTEPLPPFAEHVVQGYQENTLSLAQHYPRSSFR